MEYISNVYRKIITIKKYKPFHFIISNNQKQFAFSLLDITATFPNKKSFSDIVFHYFFPGFSVCFKLPTSSINSPILLKVRSKQYTIKWLLSYL